MRDRFLNATYSALVGPKPGDLMRADVRIEVEPQPMGIKKRRPLCRVRRGEDAAWSAVPPPKDEGIEILVFRVQDETADKKQSSEASPYKNMTTSPVVGKVERVERSREQSDTYVSLAGPRGSMKVVLHLHPDPDEWLEQPSMLSIDFDCALTAFVQCLLRCRDTTLQAFGMIDDLHLGGCLEKMDNPYYKRKRKT
ncbi:uncharacterized protein BO97DRAFT_258127 [Aspergillus homomorphus CBS 101889]|uniref:Uncharacterized protein n=1 Tax=Aspergillus homomorphus (strain CBS 101889) TaxID=1450537 RepID=A0A395I4Y1_ASPHC|nr:hypothetical protein BO97DRAFT_258127 [Aspergillus homomorphus CBS 101889]RAL14835.1 hypothetical protein BO97DRAFT_258127 [Aspergillus homomorphus CBS 101889]